MGGYQRDMTGASAAIRITSLLHRVGMLSFPVDVDHLALNYADTFDCDDPIIRVEGDYWDGIEGGLFANEDRSSWIITFNLRSNTDRQRFTKAHELGHYVLHRHERTGFTCENGAISNRSKSDALIEAQANQFASYLLMPADEVRRRLTGQPITFHLLSSSATFFGVSLEAMCIRYLELTDQRVVLFKWISGFLDWNIPSPSARLSKAFYKKSPECIPPPPGSLAEDESVQHEWDGERVPSQCWFTNEPEDETLREMKHVSDEHERILTLLVLAPATKPWEREESEPEEDS